MAVKAKVLVLGALLCISASWPASAQTVYKCGSARSVKYTDQPCSRRIVNTGDAPVPAKQAEDRRIEQNRAVARAMRPRAGETTEDFETRRRRARLLNADRDECARLDTRMPVEKASMKNPDQAEVAKAEAALEKSRKRFSELRC